MYIKMKISRFIIGLALVGVNISYAQTEKCDCSAVFEELVQGVEDNYIYLAQLRLDGNAQQYDARIEEYRAKAGDIKSSSCTEFLTDFVRYFEDGHLFVYEQPKYTDGETDDFRQNIKKSKVDVKVLQQALKFGEMVIENDGLDGIVGKWTDGSSEFAIVKDEGKYKAYILNTDKEGVEPGELKAEFIRTKHGFKGTYYSYGHQPRYMEGNIYKEKTLLKIIGASVWGKVDSSGSREAKMINRKDVTQPRIVKLDEENTLFSIPSFSYDYNKFIKIVLDNEELLRNTTNLIFDIRGNTGGNGVYHSFLGLYADRPKPANQGKVLASQATLAYFERFAKNSKRVYGPVADRIKNNMGQIVDGPLFPKKKYKPEESKIKNVAILTDNACASASESFILHSKQVSGNVKTFGSPTYGMIDYTSVNVLKLNSGDQSIFFGYPTGTWHKEVIPEKGYNKTGIIPDIPIDTSVADKVQFIVDYYKHQKE